MNLSYYIGQLKIFSNRRKLEVALTDALEKVQDLSVEYPKLETNITEGITAILNDRRVLGADKLSLPTLSNIYDLDIVDEWVVEKLIPKKAITVLHGRGGIGKTWLLLQMGSSIADGKPFCGLSTIQGNVYYIDFENPMSVLHQRVRVLGKSSVQVWHLSHNPPPPRLDSDKWILYKLLPPGVIIFDSMRSAHNLDENSSKDITFVMSRLKELREVGHTIIALLHAPKGDPRTYRGSTALIDQCDHALGFEKVKAVDSDSVVDDEGEDNMPFRLGHIQKTRFAPFKIYLRFDPERGFSLAPNPEHTVLESMRQLLLEQHRVNGSLTQDKFAEIVKTGVACGKEKALALIRKGDGIFWHGIKERKFNRILYTPVFHENDGSL
jgi:hypothetical protein